MQNNLDRFRKEHRKRKENRIRNRHYHSLKGDRKESKLKQIDEERVHPLFSKESFLIKIFISICLFLSVAILFKQQGKTFEKFQTVVTHTFEQDFKFATVATWYEQQFGRPLALLPEKFSNQDTQVVNQAGDHYAVPVTGGRIVEPFNTEKKGIMIEAGKDATIESVQDGFVVFVGDRENLNKTVIVQHHDGSESWYGNLDSIDVALYDYIKSGHQIGKALVDDSKESGVFFFALKKGESFIDPIQVMSFD